MLRNKHEWTLIVSGEYECTLIHSCQLWPPQIDKALLPNLGTAVVSLWLNCETCMGRVTPLLAKIYKIVVFSKNTIELYIILCAISGEIQ